MDNNSKLEQKIKFPDGFMLGTATSAFQIEGEGNTEWKGFVGKDGTHLGNAIDHYNRFEKDLEYILYLGNAYRFSPDWSKLQEGPYFEFNKDAVKHYEKIFKTLKDNNKKVMLVLNHFANPLWMTKEGGWTNSESVGLYMDYSKQILQHFSNYIDFINTFNEPEVYINNKYATSQFPKGKLLHVLSRSKALKNMARAHEYLYDYIKNNYSNIQVGISKSTIITDVPVAKQLLEAFHLEPPHELFVGKPDEKSNADYIGFSYYGKHSLSSALQIGFKGRVGKQPGNSGLEHDDLWLLYPEGIYEMIKMFSEKYKKPIIVTENGTCTENDNLRIRNMYNHLAFVNKARDEGISVLGYFYWSTFDNYETSFGTSYPFGLVGVNYNTFERKLKKSGKYYHDIAEKKALLNPEPYLAR
jgi:beta-glucosidase